MTRQPALFARPRRKRRACLLTIEIGRRSAWLSVVGAGLVHAIDAVGSPRQWDPTRRQWMVPARRAHDLAAHCEHALGMAVAVVAVER